MSTNNTVHTPDVEAEAMEKLLHEASQIIAQLCSGECHNDAMNGKLDHYSSETLFCALEITHEIMQTLLDGLRTRVE